MMQEGEKRNETAAPVPAEPTSVPDAAVVATPVKEKAAENGVHTNGIAE
jgi:hypothetical protein